MARKRFLSPDVWTDAKVRKLSYQERLLFIGLITLADDEGRVEASPSYLRGQLFPDDGLTDDEVAAIIDTVVRKNKNITRYAHCKVTYITLLNWAKYQKPSHPTPSHLPPPPRYKKGLPSSGELREDLAKDSRASRENFAPGDGGGVGGGVGVGRGEEELRSSSGTTPYSPPKGGRTRKPKTNEFDHYRHMLQNGEGE